MMRRRECLKLVAGAAVASCVSKGRGERMPTVSAADGFAASSLVLGAAGRENALAIRRFVRAGGLPGATPTTALVWWDRERLHVEFHNSEPDPLYRGNPGLAKPIKFPGNERFQLSAYPDAVYVQYRSDWKNGQADLFAVDSSGACDGEGFDAEVERQAGVWTAHLQIPWARLGGRPGQSYFGLNLARSRWQSSEILSPVALDPTHTLPRDQMMVCRFGGRSELRSTAGFLIDLPDGSRRWQLPAAIDWPDRGERRELWREQQDLDRPTTSENFAKRIALAQRLHDTLVLEGFSFHTDGSNWPVKSGEYYPDAARMAVNRALRERDEAGAYRTLDVYLRQLDRVVRRWFADESMGNIRAGEWTPVVIRGCERQGNRLRLDAVAGKADFPLWLSICGGALRLNNEHPGFFQADASELVATADNTFCCGDGQVRIEDGSRRISVRNRRGNVVWGLGNGDLAVRLSPSGEVLAIDLGGKLLGKENLYGFGERFNALGQRGNVVTLWDVDCWDGNIHGRLNQAYKNVPLAHSTRGYTLFWNTTYRLRADIGNADPNRYRLTAFGNIFDLFLWPTNPQEALRGYTALTGQPIMPPRWAFEPWMGGGGRRWSNGPRKNAVREEIDAVEHFRALDIPHSAIYAEAGNADPALYAQLKGSQLRVLAWMWDSMDIAKVRELLPEVAEAQLPLVRDAHGAIVFRDERNAVVDYTHPGTAKLLRRFWKPRLDLGLAGSMVDFGDVIPEDAVFANGKRGAEMHNFHAYSYHRAYAEVFRQARGQDYVLFARSACAGDQSSICHFAGDHQPNFVGMRAALRGGLNAAACGLSNWGADAGGYAGWPDPEVYIRWTEWAAFCPLMRYHGTTPREPWEYGDQAVVIYKRYAWLRENLLPYIVQSAAEAHTTGISLMRPMPFAFPDSEELAGCDDQYMFGPEILVAPVLGPGESREVLLPPGRWTDFWTAKSYSGPRTLTIATPIDRIGVFLRADAFVPVDLAPSLVAGESMSAGRVKAALVTGSAAAAMRRAEAIGADFCIILGDDVRKVVRLNSSRVSEKPA